MPLSKKIKIGHVSIINKIKYFEENKFFFLNIFNNKSDIEIMEVNCTRDPNCSEPTAKPSDIKTSPIPACSPVNHSGKSKYLSILKYLKQYQHDNPKHLLKLVVIKLKKI